MREWRNWQTRTFEVRVVHHTGSSPVSRTRHRLRFRRCFFVRILKFVWYVQFMLNMQKYMYKILKCAETTCNF